MISVALSSLHRQPSIATVLIMKNNRVLYEKLLQAPLHRKYRNMMIKLQIYFNTVSKQFICLRIEYPSSIIYTILTTFRDKERNDRIMNTEYRRLLNKSTCTCKRTKHLHRFISLALIIYATSVAFSVLDILLNTSISRLKRPSSQNNHTSKQSCSDARRHWLEPVDYDTMININSSCSYLRFCETICVKTER